ncbi:hypothetical protein [Roseivivax sp. THAF197b]|uniref:hypothetical protein n=1 Tax=Roseivivax sp. THAF197b TaxID=2588299 RepID=UPI00126834BB|nr:hypothetical protein [Roseivivax sp. THAF197b]QFS84833.1 hypothetical protein FIV09_18480 [Roseivivax sp. THAF197b]
MRTTQNPWIRGNISQHTKSLQSNPPKAEADMEAVIRDQDDLRDQAGRLSQIKGTGPLSQQP